MHALPGHGRCNVWDEKDVLGITYDNPSTRTRHILCATGRLLQYVVWHTVHKNKLYLLHLQPVQGSQQGTNISIYSFIDESYARLVYPSISILLRGIEHKVYAMEVWVCDHLINCIQVTSANNIPEQYFFVRGLV